MGGHTRSLGAGARVSCPAQCLHASQWLRANMADALEKDAVLQLDVVGTEERLHQRKQRAMLKLQLLDHAEKPILFAMPGQVKVLQKQTT
eukprot:m.27689 g.27689  ORF g.27689 m.27689 type:complete len:90 (+) comp10311_c0_seq1:40-309(+)